MSDSPKPLPFQGKSKKKKALKSPSPPKVRPAPKPKPAGVIPEVVSNRMVKRMALFSGVPTALGMLSFVAFYGVVSQGLLEIPTYVVFAVSLLCFGLGVVGLSYGVFSTSWDEEQAGSGWGWTEFQLNFGRTLGAWRSNRKPEKES
jgi:hypothetical protein